MTKPDQTAECPHCEEFRPVALFSGGVCHECQAAIRRHHIGVQKGHRETPADFGSLHRPRRAAVHAGDICFSENGEVTSAAIFDFNALDHLDVELEEYSPEEKNRAGEVLEKVFLWAFHQRRPYFSGVRRLMFALATLRPELFGDKTHMAGLAKRLKCTKALASKVSLEFCEYFKLRQTRVQRGADSRARMRAAQLAGANHWHRKRKSKTTGISVTKEPQEP